MKTEFYMKSTVMYFFLGLLIPGIIFMIFGTSSWWINTILIISGIGIIIMVGALFIKLHKIEIEEDYFIYYDNRFKEPTDKWKWSDITEIKLNKKVILIVNNNDQKNSLRLDFLFWDKVLIDEIERRAINASKTYND
ncbi:hypothetical protein VQL36_10225 [Chengkuizengella sp. SCS-71B]|uniref:hypothetical protein n=1 Tax=Chengkuizengella sp. SCS-71B TaxID=3115290 RepID=UPI0032C23E25